MLQEKVELLFETLNLTTGDITEAAGCTTSTISRLRSGARSPKPDSPTIDKLVTGIIQYTSKNGITDKLLKLIETTDDSHLEEDLLSFLFSGDAYLNDNQKNVNSLAFSRKLDSVMSLLDISNVNLARAANVDASYISRFRSGKRSPGSNPQLLDKLCMSLFDKAVHTNRLSELSELFSGSAKQADIENKDELFLHFHAWMTNFNITDRLAVSHLLCTINTFTEKLDVAIPPLSNLVSESELYDTSTEYMGIDGLRRAVLRFLGNAVKERYPELLLYSDQGMEWMLEDSDFKMRWAFLMASCAKQGTKIKIIHNIDRNVKEMLSAIESWLPLYVTGVFESYYHKKQNGTRFKHTIFLVPKKSCISACHVSGMDDKGIYNYYTDSFHLGYYEENFKQLMLNTGRLATIEKNVDTDYKSGKKKLISEEQYNDLTLSLTRNKITITKISASPISISFTHPLMVNAFKEYLESS
ncbi:MAG: hypothetical protein IKQ71_05345 [Lachnospiraceae bacterium]|nr:hypothetical protein [Lachnospiraceae bacterium]